MRIFASVPFYEAVTGAYIPQGQVTNTSTACQVIDCTVSGTNLTIPDVVLATTTDSTVPNATYTAWLYDSNDNRQYPLLSQFFVDPEYFQSPPQYSVLVAVAGTAAANGLYTYRGQFNNLPYYNLTGQVDSTSLFAIVNTGSQWRLYSSVGTNLYHSFTNTDFPYDSVWVTGSGSSGTSPEPTVSQDSNQVSGTWEQLTLSNQGFAIIPPSWPGPFWNVQQIKEYVNSIVGDGTTPFASQPVVGKTALSVNPALSTFPIAYGVNDPAVPKFRGQVTKTQLDALTDNLAGQTAKLTDKDKGAWRYNGARWVPVDSGRKINVLDYCDPTALDNTAALQSAINYLDAQGGGTISFPAGYTITCSGQLDSASKNNVQLVGTNTNAYIGSTVNLLFTGTGSGSFIDIRSANGFVVYNMNIRYNNAGYTGWLIQAGHDGGGGDTQQLRIENSVIWGTPTAKNAAGLIDTNASINGLISNNHFLYANKGIRGREGSGGYSYTYIVARNEFNDVLKHYWNPDNWVVTMGSSEPDANNEVVVFDSDGLGFARGLVVNGGFSGDGGAASQAQMTFWKCLGLIVQGFWATLADENFITVKESNGILIHGCRVEGGASTQGVILDGSGTGNVSIVIQANSLNVGATNADCIVMTGANNNYEIAQNDRGGSALTNRYSTGINIIGSAGGVDDPYGVSTSSLGIGGLDGLPSVGSDSLGARIAVTTSYPGQFSNAMTDGSLVIQPRAGVGSTGIALWDSGNEVARIQNNALRLYKQWSIGLAKVLTPGVTVSLNAGLGNLFTLIPAQNCQIDATGMIAGQLVLIRVLTSGVTPYTITFGTNFKPKGTLNTGSTTAVYFDILFDSDGTNLIEVCRSGGLDASSIGTGVVSTTEFEYLNGVTSAIQAQLDAKAALISPSFTTPTLGVATGTSLTTTGLIKSSGTAGIGYATGAGGAQTQATDKSTTVVSNTITTAITMNNAALNTDATVSFTFTNSTIAVTDTVLVTHESGGTSGAYNCNAFPGAGSAVVTVRNISTGSLSEAIVLRVTIIKSVSA